MAFATIRYSGYSFLPPVVTFADIGNSIADAAA